MTICPICEKIFTPSKTHPKQKCCSPKCRCKEYQLKNTKNIASKKKEYRENNKASISIEKKEYYRTLKNNPAKYEEHKKRMIKNSQSYRDNNREKINLLAKERYQHNKDYYADRYKKNRSRIIEQATKWSKENPSDVKKFIKQYKSSPKGIAASNRRRMKIKKLDSKLSGKDIEFIFNRDNNRCVYCESTENLSLDHIIPISKNGEDTIFNVCIACQSCNSSKGNKDVDVWLKIVR